MSISKSKLDIAYQQELQKQQKDPSYYPLSKADIFKHGKCPGDYSLGPKWEDNACELRLQMEVGEIGFSCCYCWDIKEGEWSD